MQMNNNYGYTPEQSGYYAPPQGQPIPAPAVNPQPVRPPLDITRLDRIAAFILMILSIFGVTGGLWGGFRTLYAFTYLTILTVMTAFLYKTGVKRGIFPYICGFFAFAGCTAFIITSNSSVRFWMFVCQFALSAIWIDSLTGKREERGDLGLIKNIFTATFGMMFPNMPRATAAVFSDKGGKRRWLSKTLIGILCAVPVLFIVVPLLMSSDTAFEGLIDKVIENLASGFLKVVTGLLIAPFIISFFISQKHLSKGEQRDSRFKGIDDAYIISFLSALSLCYLAYLFSQLAYFFSGFLGILPKDYEFNISTYARRGFFELTVIAAINLVIIFSALLLSKKKNGTICTASKLICLFIGLFTLLITATAFSKMIFYIQSFGMTVLRITTSAFMVFTAIVFIAVILRIFIPRIKVLRVAVITAACVLTALGVCNVNSLVARYNINAYVSGKLETVDVRTIYDLSDEGVPYLVMLTRAKDEAIKSEAVTFTEMAIEKYYDTEHDYEQYAEPINKITVGERLYNNLEDWSLSRSKAYDALEEYMGKRTQKFIRE